MYIRNMRHDARCLGTGRVQNLISVLDTESAQSQRGQGRVNWSQKIYEKLFDRIRRGEIEPEQKLVDVALAETMGVSRMPVREALFRLSHEGYLTPTTRGFALTRISASEAGELFEIRRLLEPRAAAAAAVAMSDAAIADLEAQHRRAETTVEAGDGEGFTEANRLFRQIWLDNVPQRRLAETIERFVVQTNFIRNRTFAKPEAQRIALSILTQLVAAFRRRDTLLVNDSVALLVDRGHEQYVALLASEEADRP